MPIQTTRHVGPAVQPARCRPLTPDASGSALEQKPGWWCDGRGMLWENYEAERKTAVSEDSTTRRRFSFMLRSNRLNRLDRSIHVLPAA